VIHALAPQGRQRLTRFLARRPLLTFDIDGTLAPIVARPDAARIPEPLQRALARLCAAAPVAVLTGRARDDARRMLAFAPAYVLGNHGVEGLPGWEARIQRFADICAAWRAALDGALPSLAQAGVRLEDKRYSLSLHYRRAPDAAYARRIIAAHLARLSPPASVVMGKRVVNVLPPGAPTKGDALRALLDHVPYGCAVYAGDDETDEHVFDLPEDLLLGVRVGAHHGSGAALYIDDPDLMLTLVEFLREHWGKKAPYGTGG
jgi:trehalose 6-phosphate phosphatase